MFKVVDPVSGQTRETSVYDYLWNEYPECRDLFEPDQRWPPCNVGTQDRPVYVPFEFCFTTPGQPFRRLLNPDQTQEMIEYAVQPPNYNALLITDRSLPMYKLRDANSQADSIVGRSLRVWLEDD